MSLFCKQFGMSQYHIVAIAVILSVVVLLLAFAVGGPVVAGILHAVTIGVLIRYMVGESHRVRAKVRERTLALQDLAYRDGLTCLPNRRFFIWYLEQYLPRQTRRGQQGRNQEYRVVLFDLNGFKAVNDTYGHEAGDELLRFISNTLLEYLPMDAVLARLGGDEFVVLVRDRPQGRKINTVVRAINEAASSTLVFHREHIQVSASIGVSSISVGRTPVSQLLREADERMYEDKQAQREGRSVERPGGRVKEHVVAY